MPTKKLFNATTQALEDAELSVDHNNDIIATFSSGDFLKFPAGMTKTDFAKQIDLVQQHNEGQVVITPEYEAALAAEKANSEALINDSSGASSNATSNSTTS